jgi:hypothetical protein
VLLRGVDVRVRGLPCEERVLEDAEAKGQVHPACAKEKLVVFAERHPEPVLARDEPIAVAANAISVGHGRGERAFVDVTE